jgi:amino acid adenylation domain-containing protein
VDPALAGRLRGLARGEGTTPYTLLLAAWQLLLARWSGQDDLLVGSPASGRGRPALADVVGYLVNPVVLRARVDADAPFRALLAAQRGEALGALGAQAYPFERLVEQLQPERDAGRTPLFQAMFVLQQAARLPSATACALGVEGASEARGPLVLEPVAIPQRAAQFDLVLEMGEVEGGLAGLLRFDADLFEPATARRMAGHLVRLLEGIAADPATPAGALELLTEAEREEVTAGFNHTDVAYPGAGTPLHRLVEAQVRRTPDAPAVVFEGGSLTYAELDRRADRLAAGLRARGVGPETRVGVCMERSPELVVSLLAVLKAGGAYVPLDPDYPAERLAHMAADSAVPVLLAQPHLRGGLPESGAETVLVDGGEPAAAPDSCPGAGAARCAGCGRTCAAVEPDNLAYVIYTSGSTGLPKGAMNTHRGVVNRLLWMQAEYGLGPEEAVLQKTPFSFDVSVWELFWPLLVGARLVLARPGGHRDPAYLRGLIEREGITTLHFVPSMLHAFLEAADAADAVPAGLRRVVCSGEALPVELQERFFGRFPGVELHNLYGPTEAAVDVTSWACRPGEVRRSVPIGRPVANTRCYVLDARLAPAPVGVPGELYLGGVQVGRGYLARPALTAERFVPDPFSPGGERLYRTGDLARRLPDGTLEYLGRTDAQVKVRGFRVEPGEIEAVLGRHPGVRECAVVPWEPSPGDVRLAAYLVPRGAAPGAAELREHLRGSLPEHMVPSAFVELEALPLTPSGKLDRRALPRPQAGPGRGAAEYVAPRSGVEETLARIWAGTLGVERVGVHDDFFALGGHSLLAVRVASRVQESFGVSLPLHTLFQSPTVESLSRRIALAQLEAQPADDLEALLAELEAAGSAGGPGEPA